jgi:hypothetical protein
MHATISVDILHVENKLFNRRIDLALSIHIPIKQCINDNDACREKKNTLAQQYSKHPIN